jgi:transcriptional regulator with XRE-family HTH domain
MAAKKKAAKKVAHRKGSEPIKQGSAAREALDGAVDALSFLEALDGPLTFGRHLRAIRQGEELSLEAFAKKLGVTRMYVSDIEHGRRSVSVPRAAEWAGLLGYSREQFVRLALQAELDEAGLALEVTVTARPQPESRRKAPRARHVPAHAN